MKKYSILFFITLQILCFAPGFSRAQQATEIKPNPTEKKPEDEAAKKNQEKMLDFVRSAGKEVAVLQRKENRLVYWLDVIEILESKDDKSAQEFLQNATGDFRLIFTELQEISRDTDDISESDFYNSGPGSYRSLNQNKILREKLVMSLAKYDADKAFDFMLETRLAEPLPQPEGKRSLAQMVFEIYGREENRLEARLASVVAKSDPNRAYQLATSLLNKGFPDELATLMREISRKDKEKGEKLVSEVLRKLGSANIVSNYEAQNLAFNYFLALMGRADDSPKNATGDDYFPLTVAQKREFAEMLIRQALEMPISEDNRFGFFSRLRESLPLLQKYAPASAAGLQRKLAQDPIFKAGQAYTSAVEAARPPSPTDMSAPVPKTVETVGEGNAAKTPETISIAEIRTTLAKIKGRTARLQALSETTKILAQRGQTEEAKEFLDEASGLLNPQLNTFKDFMEYLLIIPAMSQVAPDKAFSMLEQMIAESNNILTSSMRIFTFIGEGEIVENGELNAEFLSDIATGRGGMSPIGGVLNESLLQLAKTDFDRTVNLADKFERSEVRMAAKMLIAKSLLSRKKSETTIEGADSGAGIPAEKARPIQ